jgi:heavy metal sensor kinase
MNFRKTWESLRFRLVAWYSLLAGLSILASDGYTYFEFRQSLLRQVDRSLEVSAIQARKNLDDEVDTLVFDPRKDAPILASLLNDAGVEIYLLAQDGTVKQHFGDSLLLASSLGVEPGFRTSTGSDGRWRVFTKEVLTSDGRRSGWLTVAQSLQPVDATLRNVFRSNLLKLPLCMAMVGLGGLFVANRALKPISQIIRTAENVRVSGDLAQRINYQGSTGDELARLARLFDEMLASLETTFYHERRFTADASHELRTPLTALKGRLQVTLSQPRNAETYEDTLRTIGQEVDRLIRLSNDLLLLTRLEQNHANDPLELIDLSDLLAETAAQIRPLADLGHLELSTDLAPGLRVLGSPDHLIRLFLNLLDNAVKHTPPHGTVSLKAVAHQNGVQVSISDTGPGIAVEHLSHVFDRFYRVDKSRSRVVGGTGLGLAIAQEIVNSHHGTISAVSQPGHGTTMIVNFPAGGG